MIVRSDKINVGVVPNEINHLFELAREIIIIILCEKDTFGIVLVA
jgi:hypothetical protein